MGEEAEPFLKAGQEDSREKEKLVPVSPHDKAQVITSDRGLSLEPKGKEDDGDSRECPTVSEEDEESAEEEGRTAKVRTAVRGPTKQEREEHAEDKLLLVFVPELIQEEPHEFGRQQLLTVRCV